MDELVRAIKKPEPPMGDAQPLAFIMKNQDQDFLAHIAIPPPNANTKDMTPNDYQIKEVILGRTTIDTTKVLITMGV